MIILITYFKNIKSGFFVPKTFTNTGPGQHNKNLSQLSKISYSMGAKPLEKEPPKYPGPGKYNAMLQIGKNLVLSTS